MKPFIFLFTTIIMNSCCSPYYVKYVNPLFLEETGYEKSCLLRPCKNNEDCNPYIPWLNYEYEYATNHFSKFGLTYIGYSNVALVNFTGNFITKTNNNSSNNKLYGMGMETQLGVLDFNEYYSSFIGLEFNHFFSNRKYNQFHPTIGFALPLKYINAFQIKGGYQFNTSKEYNYWTLGINFKMPIYPLY